MYILRLEEYCLLARDVVNSCTNLQMFRRKILLPYSGRSVSQVWEKTYREREYWGRSLSENGEKTWVS
jgi:hypothetical protein